MSKIDSILSSTFSWFRKCARLFKIWSSASKTSCTRTSLFPTVKQKENVTISLKSIPVRQLLSATQDQHLKKNSSRMTQQRQRYTFKSKLSLMKAMLKSFVTKLDSILDSVILKRLSNSCAMPTLSSLKIRRLPWHMRVFCASSIDLKRPLSS